MRGNRHSRIHKMDTKQENHIIKAIRDTPDLNNNAPLPDIYKFDDIFDKNKVYYTYKGNATRVSLEKIIMIIKKIRFVSRIRRIASYLETEEGAKLTEPGTIIWLIRKFIQPLLDNAPQLWIFQNRERLLEYVKDTLPYLIDMYNEEMEEERLNPIYQSVGIDWEELRILKEVNEGDSKTKNAAKSQDDHT